jgi:hypothetical protein
VFLGGLNEDGREHIQLMHWINELLRCLPRQGWPVVRELRAQSAGALPELAATRAIVFHNELGDAACLAV